MKIRTAAVTTPLSNREKLNQDRDYGMDKLLHACKSVRCDYLVMSQFQWLLSHNAVEVKERMSNYTTHEYIDVTTSLGPEIGW